MKTVTKLSLIAATVAAFASSAAFADDQQLQNRLALQRDQMQGSQKSTTIAVYAGRHGVSQRSTMRNERTETRFELRSNAHGQVFGAYVPVR